MATALERTVLPYTVRTLVVRVVVDQSTSRPHHSNQPASLACRLLPLVTYLVDAAVMIHGLTGAPKPVD